MKFPRTLISLLLLSTLGPVYAKPAAPKKKLVVVIVVDQMREDYLGLQSDFLLAPANHGGFRRLAEEGVDHKRAFHDHFPTHTATGHSTLSTGALPSAHGVVGNRWPRPGGTHVEDAGLDPTYPAVGSNSKASLGFSPTVLRATTMGDTFKRASGGKAKVVSVAVKDRTSVLLAGRSADAALWFDEQTGNWVTSRFYAPDGVLAPFVSSWNKAHHPDEQFAMDWKVELADLGHLPANIRSQQRTEGVAGDYEGLGNAFPHHIDGGKPGKPGHDFYTAWAHTPPAVTATFQLALDAIDFYGMGQSAMPDLLYVGISSLDKLGHVYGPDSLENYEMLLQIDKGLGLFLDSLDAKVGLDNCLIVLTSDHGVQPIAEYLTELKIRGERKSSGDFYQRIVARLAPRWKPEDYQLLLSDPYVFLTPAAGKEGDKAAMVHEIQEEGKATDGVLEVLDPEELLKGRYREAPWEKAVARSLYPGRTGDLILLTDPNVIFSFSRPGGTTHGGTWTDDTHVPLLMYGWPNARGLVEMRDVAPRQMVSTICLYFGFTPPGACDAPPLPWAASPALATPTR